MMSMDGLVAGVLRVTLRLLLKPALSPRWPVPRQRRWLERLSFLRRMPRGIACTRGSSASSAHCTLACSGSPARRASAARPALTVSSPPSAKISKLIAGMRLP